MWKRNNPVAKPLTHAITLDSYIETNLVTVLLATLALLQPLQSTVAVFATKASINSCGGVVERCESRAVGGLVFEAKIMFKYLLCGVENWRNVSLFSGGERNLMFCVVGWNLSHRLDSDKSLFRFYFWCLRNICIIIDCDSTALVRPLEQKKFQAWNIHRNVWILNWMTTIPVNNTAATRYVTARDLVAGGCFHGRRNGTRSSDVLWLIFLKLLLVAPRSSSSRSAGSFHSWSNFLVGSKCWCPLAEDIKL